MSRQLLSFSSNRVRKAMKSMKSLANISVQEHGVDIFSSYRGKITKDDQTIMVQERVINPKNYELARHASEDRKNFYQGLKARNHEMNIMKHLINHRLKGREVSVKDKSKKRTVKTVKTYNELKRLKRKKVKKEIKKKQKQQKVNFLTEESILQKQPSIDIFNEMKETNWETYLDSQLQKIFPAYSLNTNSLCKNLVNYMTPFEIEKVDDTIREKRLKEITHYNGTVMKTEVKLEKKKTILKKQKTEGDSNQMEDIDKMLNDPELIKKQQELLDVLNKKEAVLEKNKVSTDEFLQKIKEDVDKIKNKRYRSLEPGVGKEESKNEEEKLTPEENDQIKERVINFTLKSFDKFSLEKILTFWAHHKDEIKVAMMKNPNYRVMIREKKEVEEKERKKVTKAVNVKHIYTSPSEDIKKIIPFAAKKYTIQKKDA